MNGRHRTLIVVTSVALLLGPGCNQPTHECQIRGRVVASVDITSKACSLNMYLGHRADSLGHFPVGIGQDVAVAISLPVAAPRQRWFSVVRCEGYEDAKTPTFTLGAGWGSCPAVDLGTITLTPVVHAHQVRAPRPPNNKIQLTSHG